MRIVKHDIIDVYYCKDKQKSADIYGTQLEYRGYKLEHRDAGTPPYDFCDQYIKTKILNEDNLKRNASEADEA